MYVQLSTVHVHYSHTPTGVYMYVKINVAGVASTNHQLLGKLSEV